MTHMEETTLSMGDPLEVVVVVVKTLEALIVVDSAIVSTTSICSLLRKYSETSLEAEILLQTSLTMRMMTFLEVDFQEWVEALDKWDSVEWAKE